MENKQEGKVTQTKGVHETFFIHNIFYSIYVSQEHHPLLPMLLLLPLYTLYIFIYIIK